MGFLVKTFTNSVFQTQVGHRNKKLQSGLFGLEIQAFALKIELEIDLIASS